MFWTDPLPWTTALIVALAIQWILARKNSFPDTHQGPNLLPGTIAETVQKGSDPPRGDSGAASRENCAKRIPA